MAEPENKIIQSKNQPIFKPFLGVFEYAYLQLCSFYACPESMNLSFLAYLGQK